MESGGEGLALGMSRVPDSAPIFFAEREMLDLCMKSWKAAAIVRTANISLNGPDV